MCVCVCVCVGFSLISLCFVILSYPILCVAGAGEHVRQGRDLSSSEAFAASLDLPFDQLELSELIGGGGFGQVRQADEEKRRGDERAKRSGGVQRR